VSWLCGDKLTAWVMVLHPFPLQKLGIGAMSWILGVPLVVCGDSVVALRGGDNAVVMALWVSLDEKIVVRV